MRSANNSSKSFQIDYFPCDSKQTEKKVAFAFDCIFDEVFEVLNGALVLKEEYKQFSGLQSGINRLNVVESVPLT